MTAAPDLEALLPRLRSRAADPERRTDVRPSELGASVATLDLGGLLAMGRDLGASLRDVVAANQEGRVDPAGHARALELGRAMSTPAPSVLPGAGRGRPSSPGPRRTSASRSRSRSAASTPRSPTAGSGPGAGLLPLTDVVAAVSRARAGRTAELPRGRSWPAGLLPLVERDPGLRLLRGGDRPDHRVGPGGPHRARERGPVPPLVPRGLPERRGVAGRLGRLEDAGRADRGPDGQGHVERRRRRRWRARRGPGSPGSAPRSARRWACPRRAGSAWSGAALGWDEDETAGSAG